MSRTGDAVIDAMNTARGDLTPLIEIGNTRQFLEACKKAGYKRIAIRVATKHIPRSLVSPWPDVSVFAWPDRLDDGWPAIWRIAQSFGCSSCGNSQQYQISGLPLTKGYYFLEKGEWVKGE